MRPQTSLQVANPAIGTVSRLPQTTTKAGGNVPFARLSRKAQILGFSSTGNAFGAQITQPIKAVGGYLRGILLTVVATGGTGATAPTAAADAPYNVLGTILLRDPLGQPIYQTDGYGLFLVNLFGGQTGMLGYGNDPRNAPSFSNVQTTSGSGAGNFTTKLWIPLELDSAGYCSLPSLNASSLPSLNITLAASATVYTTAPATLPTITITAELYYWAAPVNQPQLAPPGVGSSAQWSQQIGAQNFSNSAFNRITLPRTGTFIHTLIMALRDTGASNARVANYPSTDLALWVDGVPVHTAELLTSRQDAMYKFSGVGGTPGSAIPSGIIAYTFQDSVQSAIGLADTHDVLLATTPATLLELTGTAGSTGTGPDSVTIYTGELYPVDGVPYTHLAQ